MIANRSTRPLRPPPRALALTAIAMVAWASVTAGQTGLEVGRPGKDVMWVPSPDPLVDAMLALAEVSANDLVMDLGSGDGRTVIAAARLGAQAVGVEYDPDLVELSRRNAAAAGVSDRASFAAADLFETDLSAATVITTFLLPELNMKLRPRLLALAPGTRIVSNTWDLEDWQADETITLDPCPGFCMAHLWIVPGRVAGRWRLPGGELRLTQAFQFVDGELQLNDRVFELENGRLRGTELSFRAGGRQYRGDVVDGVITGTADTSTGPVSWQATRIGP